MTSGTLVVAKANVDAWLRVGYVRMLGDTIDGDDAEVIPTGLIGLIVDGPACPTKYITYDSAYDPTGVATEFVVLDPNEYVLVLFDRPLWCDARGLSQVGG